MKTKLPFIAVLVILVSACTTGTYMTRTYDDDIYFSPGDVPPVTLVEKQAPEIEKSAGINNQDSRDQQIIMSQMDKNADGSTSVNNYIYEPGQDNQNPDYQSYNMNNQDLMDSDTTIYYNDDDVKYVINNYYDDNQDIDFAYRIGRFHRPYYYNSFFYDDWYYGGYSPFYSSWNMGWGMDPWYSGYGYGYSPYSYYGYSPFAFGFGGYYGGGYYGNYYGGYSGYYGGGGYYGGFGGVHHDNYQVARRRATNMNLPGGGTSNTNNAALTGGRSASVRGENTQNNSRIQTGNRTAPNTMVENGRTRSRSIDASANNQVTKNATLVNDRRSGTGNSATEGSGVRSSTGQQVQSRTATQSQMIRPGTSTTGNVRRTYEPSTTGRTYNQSGTTKQSQNYTPSYNKPRVVNQSNYNNNSYTRPRTVESNTEHQVVKSSTTSGTRTYSEPRSSSNLRQTYQSSSSYSRGSSTSSPSRSSTYSSPSNYSSGSSYSTPSRSSSSGSYSSGSSSSRSSSSGSSSSGRSSSGSSSSGSSSSGGSGHRR